ncbi:hypothetical protein [Streptomyces sp. NBC_01210]|uniref:hypothetical protein n=1 Tax=Streptomyces sp. NBC_01210 TaxID=2903774 RepID=UPI003FA344AE
MNHETVSTELPVPTHRFTVRLSATRRGARLARRLATQQLKPGAGRTTPTPPGPLPS